MSQARELPVHRLYREVAITAGTAFDRPGWLVWGDGRPIAQFLALPDAELFRNAVEWKAAVLDGDLAASMRMSGPL